MCDMTSETQNSWSTCAKSCYQEVNTCATMSNWPIGCQPPAKCTTTTSQVVFGSGLCWQHVEVIQPKYWLIYINIWRSVKCPDVCQLAGVAFLDSVRWVMSRLPTFLPANNAGLSAMDTISHRIEDLGTRLWIKAGMQNAVRWNQILFTSIALIQIHRIGSGSVVLPGW